MRRRVITDGVPARSRGGAAFGLTIALAALLVLGRSLLKRDPALDPRAIADQAPVLVARQAAVVALAEGGLREAFADFAAVLDERTSREVRASAFEVIESAAGRTFGGDTDAARAWLRDQGLVAPVTSVGGKDRVDGLEPLRFDGPVSATVDRSGPELEITLSGALAEQMNVLLELDLDTIVLEFTRGPDAYTVGCFDVPPVGPRAERHVLLPARPEGGVLRVSIPRVGQLVAADLPLSVAVVLPGS